jgi:hypothetical protein
LIHPCVATLLPPVPSFFVINTVYPAPQPYPPGTLHIGPANGFRRYYSKNHSLHQLPPRNSMQVMVLHATGLVVDINSFNPVKITQLLKALSF